MNTVFPAEWALQDAVLLTWPHKDTDWADILPQVELTYLAIAKEILSQQALVIVAHNDALKQHISALFHRNDLPLDKVHFVVCPTNDTWARDHGPISTYRGDTLHALDFTFNGWGNKFQSELDNAINQQLFNTVLANSASSQKVPLALEGGGIESDGNGTLLTTSECLLNDNRENNLNKAELEEKLSGLLGVNHFLWLDHGYLAGDDTDSHIDTLVRFAPNDALVYVSCPAQNDEHFQALDAMAKQLQTFTTQSGKPYTLHALPWPNAKYDNDGERLPATYANYLIINNKVLVPTYQDANDQAALDVIAAAYPQHQVVGIDCVPLIHQFGSLHCITMQLPNGFLRS
ncbi:agmatine deiminase family protein [Pseudoalteromonas sp. MMG024]|uniref:agmatine deiminase family protein n=1 Tax=Pseudoalteromonas sp. MMG024 TaxID=2909980 RepID=UPI001F37DEDA|nr:agmatine deiminase family protein [Pseudoalteromonas sp. MMG024]MCF6455404.1 agmatine deiminase family protein [Pseudoalteromonas sp. MMG024]